MKFYLVVMLVLIGYASADCGCLKCSRHLQGVDVPGPAGFPVKVIFRKPKPKIGGDGGCGCCCGCGSPIKPPSNKNPEFYNVGTPGGQYSATLQLPLPRLPKPRLSFKNLKYRTDTILVPPPPPTLASTLTPGVFNPSALTSSDILNWLRTVQVAHQIPAQPPATQQETVEQQFPNIVPQVRETVPCTCPHCQGIPLLENRNFNIERPFNQNFKRSVLPQDASPCPNCQRSKRNVTPKIDSCKDRDCKKISGSTRYVRIKRDLAKRGYNLFKNMLPHSVQGAQHLKQFQQKPTLKQKLDQLVGKNTVGARENTVNQPKIKYPFHQPLKSAFGKKSPKYLHQSKPYKVSFLDQGSNYAGPSSLFGQKRRLEGSVLGPTHIFGTKKSPKLSLLNRDDHLERLTSTFENIPNQKLKKTKGQTEDLLQENAYKTFLHKFVFPISKAGAPNLAQRIEEKETVDEKTLLKKLKRLNNNPYTSNLEDQATTFLQQLLKPEDSKKRYRRSSQNHLEEACLRKKRTIILSSDEIDLPAHYEVEMVDVEDDSEEDQHQYEEIEPFEEFDDQDPIVGASPYMRKYAPPRRYYSSLPTLQPKPEIVLGKNVIQKAVREELEAHHRKMEQEKKLKEMRENLKRKRQQSFQVPQNPIFSLLTAPVKFLRHFHELSRGATPVMATIPKLVYTTKKVFKDLGKNIQRNCLDLASNVIGDFDHIHPNVIQQIIEPNGRRYRRDVADEFKRCFEENQDKTGGTKENNGRRNRKCKSKIPKESTSLKSGNQNSSHVKSDIHNTKTNSLKSSPESVTNNKEKSAEPSETGNDRQKHFAPDYSLVFENSKEVANFRGVSDKHVRKKRYVVRVVDEDDIQDQVEEYLTQKLGDQYEYLHPLQEYYNKIQGFLNNLYSSHKPLCKIGDDCYYQRPAEETYAPTEETYFDEEPPESFEDLSEEKPRKKKMQIKKIKPRVIIDKKGRPFMEYNGYKRPLMLHGKKIGVLKNTEQSYGRSGGSSEETGNRIATLIARAKTDSDIVGNSHKDIAPHQLVKERISSLLEEVDQLVHLNLENYDAIFEDLIKIENIKTSIEQDWKRMLIEDRTNDVNAKIGLLSKFKELQHVKDSSVKKIAAALRKNDNEFIRCQLINSLKGLQKLQCLISSVVEDFEQHLKMKTTFNTKREIKYVDYLAGLKFAFAKTRNDLIKMLRKDRDSEGLKYMEMLHKLKKLLISAEENPEQFENAANLLWEMKNLEKMQMETIKEMNAKLSRNYKIKKELKILFDLQKRFEDSNKELSELLGDVHVKASVNTMGQKKDIKEVIAEVKRRHEEMLQKAKARSGSLLKKS